MIELSEKNPRGNDYYKTVKLPKIDSSKYPVWLQRCPYCGTGVETKGIGIDELMNHLSDLTTEARKQFTIRRFASYA